MGNMIVIGSSGFLGAAVTRELLSAGHSVFAVQHRQAVAPLPGLTVIEGGITSLTAETLNRICPEAIFHCARPVVPQLKRLGRHFAAMLAGRYNRILLAQIAASESLPALVFAAGSLAYGNSAGPQTETAPLRPISYAKQYSRGECPVLKASVENSSRVILLRFPWILGNGSWFKWFYINPLKESGKVPLFGSGQNLMSLIGLHDAARLMIRYQESGHGSGTYNIFSPQTMSQQSFAETVAGHYGGTVAHYREIFPNGVENAVEEAFTSNILLNSVHMELLSTFHFQGVKDVLKGITL